MYVQEEVRAVIDLSRWVIWKSIYFSVPGNWALQLVIYCCVVCFLPVSLMEQRALLFWSRKILQIGCSVKQGMVISFKWLNGAMTATFTGETLWLMHHFASFMEVAAFHHFHDALLYDVSAGFEYNSIKSCQVASRCEFIFMFLMSSYTQLSTTTVGKSWLQWSILVCSDWTSKRNEIGLSVYTSLSVLTVLLFFPLYQL